MKFNGYQILCESLGLSVQQPLIPGQSIKEAIKGLSKNSKSITRKNQTYDLIIKSLTEKFSKATTPETKQKIAKDVSHVIKVKVHNNRIKSIIDRMLIRYIRLYKKNPNHIIPDQIALKLSSKNARYRPGNFPVEFEKSHYLKSDTLNHHLDLVKKYHKDIMSRFYRFF